MHVDLWTELGPTVPPFQLVSIGDFLYITDKAVDKNCNFFNLSAPLLEIGFSTISARLPFLHVY